MNVIAVLHVNVAHLLGIKMPILSCHQNERIRVMMGAWFHPHDQPLVIVVYRYTLATSILHQQCTTAVLVLHEVRASDAALALVLFGINRQDLDCYAFLSQRFCVSLQIDADGLVECFTFTSPVC